MSSSVNEANLEKKFLAVTNTQDSIQTLSLWILHHRAHHKKIVDIWMKVLRKAKISHRLTLFYLVNDVVQNGKRKGYPQFGEAFSEVLKEATLLVRNEKIRSSVERVFNIWGQRNVYGSSFISELQEILVNSKAPKTAPRKVVTDFKHENVINKIRQVVSLEAETTTKIAALNVSKLDVTKPELLQQLKDRSLGQRFSCDYDEATDSLEDVIESLEKEVKLRTQLISLLEESEQYYAQQKGEAKIVANAYRNFGAKIKSLQKKLEELKGTFPSPVPSPCAEDAPSLANSDPEADTDLPNAKGGGPDDLDSLENAPSPEGSPEGLGLTPPSSEKAQENSVGNPIPTLSNFFPQASGVMSSWLDAFSSSSKNSTPVISSPTPEVKKADPSSLDSRLSNLMQNIPSLSGGLQSSLFGGSSSGGLTPNRDEDSSPFRKDATTSSSSVREVRTPVKDECSGQNTPLQDEDVHSSNHSGFFNPPTSSSKTSQSSSKDVLKGLTNLIQTVTSATAEKPDYDPKQNISEFIKKIAPSLTHLSPRSSSSPIAFLNSPQSTFVSQPNENAHSSPPPATIASPARSRSYSNSSYSPTRADPYSGNTSSPTKAVHENLSFIPTLVPSTPHDGAFDFSGDEFPADEYNPESENYLPIDNEDDLCPVDTPSPTLLDETCESPDDLSDDDDNDIPKNLNNQRQSTLITLVADEKTPTPMVDHSSPSSEDSMSHPEDSAYQSPPHDMMQNTNVVQNAAVEVWPPPVNMQIGGNEGLVHSQETLPVPEPALPCETFIGDHDERQPLFPPIVPPPVLEQGPLNGGCETSFAPPASIETTLVSYPLSKIETVQSHRNDTDNRWFGNDWGGGFHGPRHNQFHGNEQRPNFNRRPFEQRDYPFRRGGPHSNFRPRNNWQPRRFNEFEQGPPHPKRFAPFPGRGRGWRNNFQQQQ